LYRKHSTNVYSLFHIFFTRHQHITRPAPLRQHQDIYLHTPHLPGKKTKRSERQ